MENKIKVKCFDMSKASESLRYNFSVRYIDGYCTNSDGELYAIVVVKQGIKSIEIGKLLVIDENEYMNLKEILT